MNIPHELLDYMPIVSPIPKSHFDFTRNEAQEYYGWFLKNVDVRAAYLRDFISRKRNIPTEKLNYSLDSLILVWEWFLSIAFVEKASEEELAAIRKRYEGVPQPMFDSLVKQNSLRLSTTTEYVLFDIGLYVAKMFTENYPCLEWHLKLKPKSDVNANLAVITGFIDEAPDYEKPFHPELEPISFTRTPAMKLIREPFDVPKSDDLLNWCKMWIEWIPDMRENN